MTRRFGALVELFPGGVNARNLPCYVAGSNSGLAYAWHEGVPATREESGCRRSDESCWKHRRGRLVKLDARHGWRDVRGKVAAALARVTALHKRFPNGIPVRYDGVVGQFGRAREAL